MQSCLPSVADAIRAGVPADEGTPAGTVVLRASGLRVRGGTATAGGDAAPAAGEVDVEEGVVVELDLEPRAAVGDDAEAVEVLAVRVG